MLVHCIPVKGAETRIKAVTGATLWCVDVPVLAEPRSLLWAEGDYVAFQRHHRPPRGVQDVASSVVTDGA